MRRVGWAVAAGFLLLAGCTPKMFKDIVNQATERTVHGTWTSGTRRVQGDLCGETLNVSDMLSGSGVWQGARGHIKKFRITGGEYQVPANATPSPGRIELYVTVDGTPDQTAVAATQEIPAREAVQAFERVNWLGDGLDSLNGVLNGVIDGDPAPYSVCALYDPPGGAADLSLVVRVSFKATIVLWP